jgi:hypothetical protein
MLRDAAQQKVREYIKYARQEGLTWVQADEALNLPTLAEERGAWIADLAFDYAAGVCSRLIARPLTSQRPSGWRSATARDAPPGSRCAVRRQPSLDGLIMTPA